MFFERPKSGEIAILVHIDLYAIVDQEQPQELEELALSAGADPIAFLTGSRNQPSAKFFIGLGKLEELRELVTLHEAELVIFNHALSPAQERNLEAEIKARVLDRTGLILDIFAQRARSHEGKLQVELAQLEHLFTRLIRGWTHLERQKGGIGLRGPGETQLESDRRMLRARIKSIHKRLDRVRKQRDQGRRARQRSEVPTISLVGYTNAGKSTLFNLIAAADIYAADQLFATLDPTLRSIHLADIGKAVLADTVGFIRHLPHKLVESFRATLQETISASLLLHVVDCAATERAENMLAVTDILQEIKADSVPSLLVFNKLDLLPDQQPSIDRDEAGKPVRVWLSAEKNIGVDLLLQAISELLCEDIFHQQIDLSFKQTDLRAALYERQAVIDEHYDELGNMQLEVRLQTKDWRQLLSKYNLAPEDYGLKTVLPY